MLHFLLWACAAPTPDSPLDSGVQESTERPRLQMGRISGTVTVSSSIDESLAEDREIAATLFVFASAQINVDEVLPHRVHATAPVIEPLEDISVPFVLENLFPDETPYRVLALFDTDASVWSTGLFTATSGDLLSSPSLVEIQEVKVDSGDDLQVDLLLQHIQD